MSRWRRFRWRLRRAREALRTNPPRPGWERLDIAVTAESRILDEAECGLIEIIADEAARQARRATERRMERA